MACVLFAGCGYFINTMSIYPTLTCSDWDEPGVLTDEGAARADEVAEGLTLEVTWNGGDLDTEVALVDLGVTVRAIHRTAESDTRIGTVSPFGYREDAYCPQGDIIVIEGQATAELTRGGRTLSWRAPVLLELPDDDPAQVWVSLGDGAWHEDVTEDWADLAASLLDEDQDLEAVHFAIQGQAGPGGAGQVDLNTLSSSKDYTMSSWSLSGAWGSDDTE